MKAVELLKQAGRREVTVSVGAHAQALVLAEVEADELVVVPRAGDMDGSLFCRVQRQGADGTVSYGDGRAFYEIGVTVRCYDRDANGLRLRIGEVDRYQRRCAARADLHYMALLAWVADGELHTVKGRTRNLSAGGAAIDARPADLEQLPHGADVAVALEAPGFELHAVGHVLGIVDTGRSSFARVRFTQISEAHGKAAHREVQRELIAQRNRTF